jgi:hypothetical protein
MSATEIYQAIGYRILNYAPITAITNTRIYYGIIPEATPTLPAINYFLVSSPNLETNTCRDRYQISCRANDLATCMTLAFHVHAAFNNYQGTLNNFDVQNCYYDNSRVIVEENNIFHIPVDLFFTYQRV